jgi:hypothetical protein
MNCKTARGLFSLHLDEGLSYEEQRSLRVHIDACSGCAVEYRKLERTIGLVRGLPEVAAPDMFLQNVLRSVRLAEAARERPPVRSLGERLRDFFAGLEWLSSPRVAPAALALGLVVGVTASVMILRSNRTVEVAERAPQEVVSPMAQSIEPAGGTAGGSSSIVGPSSIPVASGPFEDLIAQMMHRLEANSQEIEDTTAAREPQWGPTRDAAGIGQQVDARPGLQGGKRAGGRVYVVF